MGVRREEVSSRDGEVYSRFPEVNVSFALRPRLGLEKQHLWGWQARQKPAEVSKQDFRPPASHTLPLTLPGCQAEDQAALMEGWLQGSDCGRPWGPLDILQGEAHGGCLPGPPPAARYSGRAKWETGRPGDGASAGPDAHHGAPRLASGPLQELWAHPRRTHAGRACLTSPAGHQPLLPCSQPTDLSFGIPCPVVLCSIQDQSLTTASVPMSHCTT